MGSSSAKLVFKQKVRNWFSNRMVDDWNRFSSQVVLQSQYGTLSED